MSKTNKFTETLVDFINGTVAASTYGTIMGNKLVLGSDEGIDGGSGQPWGGVVGQLAQRLVAYDTAETASPIIPSATSLVDNLKHIRHKQLPATWFETSPQLVRDMTVQVASGLWYNEENSYISFTGAVSPTFTAPISNPRIDVISITFGGVLEITQGTEAVSPTITMPTASGVLPLAAIYLETEASGIGYPSEYSTYSGYIYKDLRPIISYPGGGGGAALTVREEDGTPTVSNVTEIIVTDGTLTDEGGGAVTITISGGGSGADDSALLWIGW